MKPNGIRIVSAAIVLMVSGCLSHPPVRDSSPPLAVEDILASYDPWAERQSEPDREFRGLWVATVTNIDWPSRPGLSVDELKTEAEGILDRAVSFGFNCVILQVRSVCDALYPSRLEPWTSFISGIQGIAPPGDFDPLAYWIEESHRRGLLFHAWINPFRAGIPSVGTYSENSVIEAHPEIVKEIGKRGYFWLDPGNPGTKAHVLAVISDILARYDIDGLQLDDYFYPYPEYFDGSPDFPDADSYDSYLESGGILGLGDWRRETISSFLSDVSRLVHESNPQALFGVSPFGIWRPGVPRGIAGKDPYGENYADSRLWLRKGIVDYLSPQLYWPFSAKAQSFPVLLGFWERENPLSRHLWPGIQPASTKVEDALRAHEYVAQVMTGRGFFPEHPGVVIYSARTLAANPGGVYDALKAGPFSRKAIIPLSPWRQSRAPSKVPEISVSVTESEIAVTWETGDEAFLAALYWKTGISRSSPWTCEIIPFKDGQFAFARTEKGKKTVIRMQAVGRNGVLGPPAEAVIAAE